MNRKKFMKMHKKILKLSNNLTNEELRLLFSMTSDRFYIFIGSLNNRMITTKITWVSMNGSSIQVNTELSELEDIRDSIEVKDAFDSLKKRTNKA